MNNLKKSIFIFFVVAACSNAFGLMDQSQPELHAAVESGDKQKVVSLLASGVDVNTRDDLGKTALHVAVEEKNNALIPLLIDAGIDLDATDQWPETALSKALIENDLPAIHILLDAGACPNVPDDSEIPLELALQDLNLALQRLSDMEHPEDVADMQSIVGIVRALIFAGADIRSQQNFNMRLTSQALQSAHGRWLPQLLEKLVQADSTIGQTWLQSSRFLQGFVTLGKAERRAFIEKVLKAQEMPNDIARLIASFWCK